MSLHLQSRLASRHVDKQIDRRSKAAAPSPRLKWGTHMTASMKTSTIRQRIESRRQRVREQRRKAAHAWLGLAGLTYDAGKSLLGTLEGFRDKAETRGEQVEATLNTRVVRLQDIVKSKLDNRCMHIRTRIDHLAQDINQRGQEAEQALKEKLSAIAPAAKSGSTPQDRHIEIEVETAPAPPVEGFDDLNVKQVIARIASLDRQALKDVRAYEEAHKNRLTVLREIDRRLAAQ